VIHGLNSGFRAYLQAQGSLKEGTSARTKEMESRIATLEEIFCLV
jgi:hypothetical protein